MKERIFSKINLFVRSRERVLFTASLTTYHYFHVKKKMKQINERRQMYCVQRKQRPLEYTL